MKKLIIILICLFSISSFASEYQSPMSLYKDNYFLAGNQEDQVRLQISAKYNILYPFNIGWYVGYTQTSLWKCYQKSDTFYTNYQPETFFRIESGNNIFNDIIIPYIDYIQVSPIQHSSSGVEGELHRSINIYYGQIQSSVGDVYNFGFNLKGLNYYTISKQNKDINDYKKYYAADIFFKLKSVTNWYIDRYELHCKFSGNPFDKGYYHIEGIFQIFTSRIQPKFFVQYCKGYNENLIFYNVKEKSFRGGLIF